MLVNDFGGLDTMSLGNGARSYRWHEGLLYGCHLITTSLRSRDYAVIDDWPLYGRKFGISLCKPA